MGSLRNCIVALVAIEMFFTTVPFQMWAQSTWIRACIVTLITIAETHNGVKKNELLQAQT